MVLNARTKWVTCALIALVVVLSLAFASTALAAPTEPTLGLTALRARIDASPLDALERHSIEGYFRTVVNGSTITTIPVHVLAITGYENPDSALILFEAYGPLTERYGGIVAGMSGSPVFIKDAGGDLLVGALSYGDYFTIGGTGLATPIDAMVKIESKYAPTIEPLGSLIKTDVGTIDRVIVSPNPAAYAKESASGALVAKPLSMLTVGGVPAGSKVFDKFQKAMAARGVNVVAQNSVSSPAVGDTSFSAPLVGGASVGALMSRGDLALYDIGTVTYGTTETVLAFGHPANWDGATSLYMTNAWVDGIWPDLEAPYKLVRPGALRGEITQDRGAGVLGKLGQMPAETPIRAHVVNTDTSEETSTLTYVPSFLLDKNTAYSAIVPMAVYPAADRLLDVYDTAGSAMTTTTIVVSDGTKTYTIVQPNVIDDSSYLLDALTYDPYNDVSALEGALETGVDDLHIVSVDFEARVSQHRNNASIVGVDVPGGIKTGVNHAQVRLLAYGKAATQTVDVDFTVPAGVNTLGVLRATSSYNYDDFYGYIFDEESFGFGPRTTVKSVVDDLNSQQPNNVINVSFQPAPMSTSDDEEEGGAPIVSETPITGPQSIDTSVSTTWSVSGEAEAGTPIIVIRRLQSPVGYNGGSTVSGYVQGPDVIGKLSVFGTKAGTPGETFLGYASVTYTSMSDTPFFSFRTGGLKANTTLRLHLDGDDENGWTSTNTSARVLVHAKVGVQASDSRFNAGKRITLTSAVYPTSTVGGTVTFQRWNASQKRWRSIGSAKLVMKGGSAKAAISWKPGSGTYKVRARYAGGSTNIATSSYTTKVTVK